MFSLYIPLKLGLESDGGAVGWWEEGEEFGNGGGTWWTLPPLSTGHLDFVMMWERMSV